MSPLSRGWRSMILLTLFWVIKNCNSFSPVLLSTTRSGIGSPVKVSEEDDQSADASSIPQLPAIGESSFGSGSPEAHTNQPTGDMEATGEFRAFVADKFEIQYTCKVCETRNSHRVSRIAYRSGVVITVCKGCDSKHLIADNLGGFEGDTNNIEDYLESKGLGDAVNRVSHDVFMLEQLLGIETDSGSIIGEGGSPAME